MPYVSIEIEGLRGFEKAERLNFAIPNGTDAGSGLTMVVGENNSGKSTVIEAIRSFAHVSGSYGGLSFSEGRRNKKSGDKVRISLKTDNDQNRTLQTRARGGSEVEFDPLKADVGTFPRILALPSRRHFQTFLGAMTVTRDNYAESIAVRHVRGGMIESFPARLMTIASQGNSEQFDAVLGKLIDPVPSWLIEQADHGQYYVKIRCNNEQSHASEGMGEGIISLLGIADALYDSKPGDLIAIDEPELSLHPSVLRRVNVTLGDYAKDRQIVVATHSPYFADPVFICNGAALCRVFSVMSGSKIAQVSEGTVNRLRGFLNNRDNPHVLGLDSREIFFQKEGIILVEGQEDVVFYPDVERELGIYFRGTFFGWGVGGAGNMAIFANLLRDLGFAKVVGLLDADKKDKAVELQGEFPAYRFLTIPANDVRTKDARSATEVKIGLLAKNGKLREEYRLDTIKVIEQTNNYLTAGADP